MIKWLFPKLLGGKDERELHRLRPTVSRINEIEEQFQREPVAKLHELTNSWREHLSRYHPLEAPTKVQLELMTQAELQTVADSISARFALLAREFSLPSFVRPEVASIESAKSAFHAVESDFSKPRSKYLEKILPEACAVVKNAARRLCGTEVLVSGQPQRWNMVHFDVQLLGGVAIHRGMIAEMQTGEGKTLVGTIPVFLNALTGLGVHLVTVNDYLAQRDSEWMGALYRSLGISVGCLLNQMPPHQRREQYACDITYGTNSEFGFDYLRDNGMATTKDEQVQRGHYFAVIDEVDSVLIDEARTPLIITGPSPDSSQIFEQQNADVEKLVKRQTELCNQLATEAKKLLDSGKSKDAGLVLLKLKLGQPRNRQFLRLMENPEHRRLLEGTELTFFRQMFQKDLLKLKEELFFAVDERTREADLMEKGRRFLSPDDPDCFTIPDTSAQLSAIEANPNLDPEKKAIATTAVLKRREEQALRVHAINQLLKAHCLHERDVHYVVRDGKITIVDESTGREMEGRRWSDGLHQAVEAKERVKIERENRTYATITIQNYFRLYEKLAGMTGTASTEAAEFHDIYKLDVLPIPTNAPNQRVDDNDQIFKTRREKYNAVISRIEAAHTKGQPVLVGTASVEASETVSRMLKRAKIPHTVLNAKFHDQEAEIVALAGEKGAVTVATNMAGRGTDIKLGDGVGELGGLFIIGTERHFSRRVDRQLRGRCSRQGDPGRAQFFVSLEDDLMRNHASPAQMASMIERDGKGSSLGKLVETAQTTLEQRDYKSRKRVLDFDDVMNLQREIVYEYRNDVLGTGDMRRLVHEIISECVTARVQEHLSECDPHDPDHAPLLNWLRQTLNVELSEEELSTTGIERLVPLIVKKARDTYDNRLNALPAELVEREERMIVISSIDGYWQEHLRDMDELREGVYLRAQGQKDPLVEYKNEAYELFVSLMGSIKQQALLGLLRFSTAVEAARS
ncbi:preprotein translocase subunit SecA [Luteolibacter arcticus]|uniref:Protein translocase subunit SecA n=1 Tax=Luteolibacter arcticus TaxID=1581411 RepID=A0ABT3GRL2_9BACT|nr:preprotein translocase subunit SecA [Luteolibacter arcticus]MCW1926135.1 preprotein translocase subunit SecA [Luteolibacter arcticus]